MVSFHHKYLDNVYGKVVCIGETDQNGAFVGKINFDVANLVHRAIPIMLHDTEDGSTKRRQLLVLTYVLGLTHVNFTMLM
jgi:hypothetical protein